MSAAKIKFIISDEFKIFIIWTQTLVVILKNRQIQTRNVHNIKYRNENENNISVLVLFPSDYHLFFF